MLNQNQAEATAAKNQHDHWGRQAGQHLPLFDPVQLQQEHDVSVHGAAGAQAGQAESLLEELNRHTVGWSTIP